MPRIGTLSVLVSLVAIGVATGSSGCSSDASGAEAADTSATSSELVLRTSPITLQPSEEKYLCWDLPIGAGAAFAAGAIDMEIPGGIHHYQLTSNAAAASPQPPAYECGMGEGGAMGGRPPGAAGERPAGGGGERPGGAGGGDGAQRGLGTTLSVGGPTTPGVHFPEGTALLLQPGTRLSLQLHILNASPAPKEYGVVAAHVRKANGDPAKLQEVGVLLVNDDALAIPALSKNVAGNAGCKPVEALDNVFAIWPHMHLLGTSASFAIGDREVVSVPSWSFDDQKLFTVKENIAAGAPVSLRCRYDNPGDKQVSFGMGTNDEMCSAFVYYYPARKNQGCAGGEGAP